MFGRTMALEGSSGYDPSPHADCFMWKGRPQPGESVQDQIIKSQVEKLFCKPTDISNQNK